jgi:hypothetical protein
VVYERAKKPIPGGFYRHAQTVKVAGACEFSCDLQSLRIDFFSKRLFRLPRNTGIILPRLFVSGNPSLPQ